MKLMMPSRPTGPLARGFPLCWLAHLSLWVLLAGCSPEEVVEESTVPRVKVVTVGKQATGQSRRISGSVVASDRTTLSFGVGGQILEVLVDPGVSVIEGQLLAQLDEAPLLLKVEDGRAQVTQARARLVEAESTYGRAKELLEGSAGARKDLEAATSALAVANSDLKAAQNGLDQAQRDLGRAKLIAPFAGQVVSVSVDPFQDIGASGEAFVLQAEGALDVELLVPETLIREVDFGQSVDVGFPTLEDVHVQGQVLLIGAETTSGNAFPVTVRLSDSEHDLRPGMTASVTFNFQAYLSGRTAYLIPISAIAVNTSVVDPGGARDMGTAKERAPLYVFDGSSGTVRLREVRVGDLRGNEVEVFEGLEAGDQVVTAGVAFLRDGMSAEVWVPRR